MKDHLDLLIQRARLRSQPERLVEIGIADGRIASIAEQVDGKADVELDAQGKLVTESFANPHLHLCKVYTRQMMDEEALRGYHTEGMGRAMTTI